MRLDDGYERDLQAADQRDTEEGLCVEHAQYQHWSIVHFSGTVQVVADVYADGASPDLARMIEGPFAGTVNFLLVFDLEVEVFVDTRESAS
jgi:hypothetical protein